jgi:hypothetical protein
MKVYFRVLKARDSSPLSNFNYPLQLYHLLTSIFAGKSPHTSMWRGVQIFGI